MITILFVDDEQNILDALKRSLRSMRSAWLPAFALGGVAALAELEKARFDVIVTDMRMPGIDGLALLESVAVLYPSVVRIILSGQSDSESVIKSAGITHQFLSKPCPLDVLSDSINRAMSLRNTLNSTVLIDLLSRLSSIPTAPALYVEFERLLDSPFTSVEDVGRVIARDMGMCAKVLQLANSAIFGQRYSISDPAEAAGILGFNMLKNLNLALQVFTIFAPAKVKGFDVEQLWGHSFRTSRYAEAVAQSLSPGDPGIAKQAQAAGLLHDVGQLLIASNLPEDYTRVMELSRERNVEFVACEQKVFGVSHAEVGAYILGLWGLPDGVVEAILYHHNIELSVAPPSKVSLALYVADALACEHAGKSPTLDRPVLDRNYLEAQGFAYQVEGWCEMCRMLPC